MSRNGEGTGGVQAWFRLHIRVPSDGNMQHLIGQISKGVLQSLTGISAIVLDPGHSRTSCALSIRAVEPLHIQCAKHV